MGGSSSAIVGVRDRRWPAVGEGRGRAFELLGEGREFFNLKF